SIVFDRVVCLHQLEYTSTRLIMPCITARARDEQVTKTSNKVRVWCKCRRRVLVQGGRKAYSLQYNGRLVSRSTRGRQTGRMLMDSTVIYHNPKCGTSRNTLAFIREAGIEPQVIEYLQTPPDRATLVDLIKQAGLTA